GPGLMTRMTWESNLRSPRYPGRRYSKRNTKSKNDWDNESMGIPYNTALPPDLRALKQEIEGYARAYGLDFYETIFEVLDREDLNEVAAYGGFPTRYPHCSFGMAYEKLHKA